jgi:hypothetical protein
MLHREGHEATKTNSFHCANRLGIELDLFFILEQSEPSCVVNCAPLRAFVGCSENTFLYAASFFWSVTV